jgi:hypothetical protein
METNMSDLEVMLKATERVKGRPGPGRGIKAGTKKVSPFTDAPTLADLNLTKKESAAVKVLIGNHSRCLSCACTHERGYPPRDAERKRCD